MDSEQHSVAKSIFLHLFPGLLMIIFYIILTPILKGIGFPSIFTLILIVIFILLPFELGILFYSAKQKTGTFSLKEIVLYREKIPATQYFIFIPILMIWGLGSAIVITGALEQFLLNQFFSELPDWFYVDEMAGNLSLYSKPIIYITLILGLIINGFLGPIVEELYFRGYLLPRISRFKVWAPLINTVLFSLYHFFTPWQNATRILGVLPMVYSVWRKRNIYLGIFTHCLMNIIATISMCIFILEKL